MSSRFVSDQDPLSVPSDTLAPVDPVRFTDPTTSLDDARPSKSTLDVALDPSPQHSTSQSNPQSSSIIQHQDEQQAPSQQQHLDKPSTEHSPTHDISPLPTGPTSDPDDPDHDHTSTTPLSTHRVDEDPAENVHSTDPVVDHAVLPNAATPASALDQHSVDIRLSRSDVGTVSHAQPPLTVLMAAPIVPAATSVTHAGGAGAATAVAQPIVSPLEEGEHAVVQQPSQPPPVKKKRKTYSTEEERRQARILKNRRTAEESRQRRMKRMKELEEFVENSMVREKELQEEARIAKVQLQAISESLEQVVNEKNAIIAQKDAEIQRLQEKLQLK